MIKTLILDLDGVLTDGKQYIASDGSKLFKAFHSRDIRAIRELVAAGIEVIVLSADDWQGGIYWCSQVGINHFVVRNKLEWLNEQRYFQRDVAIIGDDSWDIPLLNSTQYAFAPSDASPSVFENCPHVKRLNVAGGQGVVAEFVRVLLDTTEKYYDVIRDENGGILAEGVRVNFYQETTKKGN